MGDEDQDGLDEGYRGQDRKQVEALDLDTADDDFELDASDGMDEELIEDDSADDEDGDDTENAARKGAEDVDEGRRAEREIDQIDQKRVRRQATGNPPPRRKKTTPIRRRAKAK